MDPDVEEDLRGLLRMADSTGSGAFDESAESSVVFSTNCSRYNSSLLLTVVLPPVHPDGEQDGYCHTTG